MRDEQRDNRWIRPWSSLGFQCWPACGYCRRGQPRCGSRVMQSEATSPETLDALHAAGLMRDGQFVVSDGVKPSLSQRFRSAEETKMNRTIVKLRTPATQGALFLLRVAQERPPRLLFVRPLDRDVGGAVEDGWRQPAEEEYVKGWSGERWRWLGTGPV